jgi:hypothetical protein
MTDPEILTLRGTVIGGIRYAGDYAVIWREMSIGGSCASGAASYKESRWNCYVLGRSLSDDAAAPATISNKGKSGQPNARDHVLRVGASGRGAVRAQAQIR